MQKKNVQNIKPTNVFGSQLFYAKNPPRRTYFVEVETTLEGILRTPGCTNLLNSLRHGLGLCKIL